MPFVSSFLSVHFFPRPLLFFQPLARPAFALVGFDKGSALSAHGRDFGKLGRARVSRETILLAAESWINLLSKKKGRGRNELEAT